MDNLDDLEGIGFWDMNLQTMEVFFSPQIYTMLGYEPEDVEIRFESWMDLMHPDDKPRVMPVVKTAVKNKERYRVEFRLKCKNGDYKWIAGRAKSYEVDEKGMIQHVMGVHLDIDAFKQNELALQKTQATLQNEHTKLQERNQELNCIFKMTEIVKNNHLTIEEMMQQMVGLIPQVFPNPEMIHARICYQGFCCETEGFVKTAAELSGDITVHGQKVGGLGVFVEKEFLNFENKGRFIQELAKGLSRTVERIRAEMQLRENEHKFRMLFETMAEGVVYHDKTGKIITANPAAEWILASSLDQMHGRTSADPQWQALDENGRAFPWEEHPVMKALRTGQPVYGKIMGVYNRREEKHHWIKVNAIPQFRDNEAEPYQVYASFEDITREYEANIRLQEINDEMEAMNEELKESMEEAKKADKAKTEFLATMSHELRTPLNGVIGFSEILRQTPLDENQQEFVDIVIHSAQNLLTIISDILDFSMMDSNKLEIKPKKANIRRLITQAVEGIQGQADQKGLTLITDIAQSMPGVVFVDPVRLKQILVNLLDNAVKFSEQGCISVSARPKEIDRNRKTVKLLFSVKDTGIGINESLQKVIFEPFSQADMSNTRKYGGLGLGLALSKELLNKMGGTLHLSSAHGNGSVFFFELDLPYAEDRIC